MATPCLNKPPGKTPSANTSRSSTKACEVFKENNPAHVSRTTSTPLVPAQSEVGAGNRNLTTDLVSRPQGEGEELIPNRTISMPASTSEPWWATRKVQGLKSKVSTGSSTMQTLPEAEKEKRVGNGKGELIESSGNCTLAQKPCDNGHTKGAAGVLTSSDTLGEKSKENVNSVGVAGEDQEESEGKQGRTEGEQGNKEGNSGASGSKDLDTGGRPGKKAGVDEKALQDKDTRDFIYDFIDKHGGVEAALREVNIHRTRAATKILRR